MLTQNGVLSDQIEQACKLSGARWAALFHFRDGDWHIEYFVRLKKAHQAALREFVHRGDISAWLAGSLHTGRVRSHGTGKFAASLGCQRVFTFINKKAERILLVGADGLSDNNQGVFRILMLNEGVLTKPANEIHELADLDSISDSEFRWSQTQGQLVGLAFTISGLRDATDAIHIVIDKLQTVFHTDRVAVLLPSADGKRLREYAGQHGTYPIVIPVESSLAGYVLECGEPLRTGDLSQVPRYYGDASKFRSALAVPLRSGNHIIGVLIIESDQPDYFTSLDENIIIVIASQLAGMLVNIDHYQETRLRARNLDLIHQMVTRIVGMTDEVEIAQLTADLLAEYFGYEFALILLPDATGQNLINVGIGGTKAGLIQRGHSFPISMGITGQVFRTGKSYLSNNIGKDSNYAAIPNWEGGAEICVPLFDGEQVIGVINLERSQKGSFSESDQILVESLAGILSSVMMNARRYKQLQEKFSQLALVREIALDIVENLDLDILLKRIVHNANEIVHAKGAEIGLVDEEQEGIRVQTSENPWYDFSGHLIPIGKGIAGNILLSKKPVRVSDYNTWAERLQLGVPAKFKTAAGVPLMLKGQVIGTLVVMDDRPNREFSDEDMRTLELIAHNIALAIHNAQLYQNLQERIEAQRQAESRLIQSERIAAAGRLTASIAHEINNPLQALHNCLYLSERNELSLEERQKYLAMARSELDRLISIVQRMLEYYRPGARDRQPTDVNEIIEKMVDLVRQQLLENRIQIQLNLTKDLPRVMVVPSQIQQVILNLVLNAMEAMPNGGEIMIKSSPCESLAPGRRKSRRQSIPVGIEVTVRDTGPGVPVGSRERIFEPFISTKDGGMGLGLSVSYGIIQAHGGTLSLISDDQSGACFRIALPEEEKV